MTQKLDACGELLARVERLAWTEREMLLDELPDLKAKRVLARLLVNDSSEMVRGAALDVLGEFGSRKDSQAVLSSFADKSWYVRASAYSAASALRLQKTASTLLRNLSGDPHPISRRYAVVAYADLIGQAAVPELLRRVNIEKHPLARVGVISALVELGETAYLSELEVYSRHKSAQIGSPARETLKNLARAHPKDRHK